MAPASEHAGVVLVMLQPLPSVGPHAVQVLCFASGGVAELLKTIEASLEVALDEVVAVNPNCFWAHLDYNQYTHTAAAFLLITSALLTPA